VCSRTLEAREMLWLNTKRNVLGALTTVRGKEGNSERTLKGYDTIVPSHSIPMPHAIDSLVSLLWLT
jgi:hypothetical protein